ncbi:MAG: YqgE/AlgH family protein [Rhizobiaceae bacterium]|nr:YqgE/AlgH family protein [Rhizobiaceae bacterium]
MTKSVELFKRGEGGPLEDSMLVAMPGLYETEFERSVILICSHSDDGAMGFLLNKKSDITFSQFMAKLRGEVAAGIDLPDVNIDHIPVHVGGPVDQGRGFVLHTAEYACDSTISITDDLSITSTLEILTAITRGAGPEKAILCLGYAGWGAGQLEDEIATNSWLSCPLFEDAVFEPEIDMIYSKTLASMGIEAANLSSLSGHA